VDQIFPLDAIADAHRAIEGGHTRGKIVVKVAEG
jgi:NADPH:quinone reductase-like Zn-dependent oxidoreductase